MKNQEQALREREAKVAKREAAAEAEHQDKPDEVTKAAAAGVQTQLQDLVSNLQEMQENLKQATTGKEEAEAETAKVNAQLEQVTTAKAETETKLQVAEAQLQEAEAFAYPRLNPLTQYPFDTAMPAPPMEMKEKTMDMFDYYLKNPPPIGEPEKHPVDYVVKHPVDYVVKTFLQFPTRAWTSEINLFEGFDSSIKLETWLTMEKMQYDKKYLFSDSIAKIPSIKTKLDEKLGYPVYFYINPVKEVVLMCTLVKNEESYELHFDRPINASKNSSLDYNYRHLEKTGATLVALCA